MKFLSVRELRNRPGRVWDQALRDDLVVTSNGKPVGLLIGVPEGALEQTLVLLRRTRAAAAVSSMRRQAAERGTSKVRRAVVDAEIRAARRGRRA
jgi:prevent-host-death family protein